MGFPLQCGKSRLCFIPLNHFFLLYFLKITKNWRLCTQLAASACKICIRVALSSIAPAHFPNQISKGRQLNSQKHGRGCGLANDKKFNYDVKMAFYTPLVCLSLVLYPSGRQWHANRPKFACDWRPLSYNLHETGATPLQDKRQADKRCVKGRLYITIIFF